MEYEGGVEGGVMSCEYRLKALPSSSRAEPVTRIFSGLMSLYTDVLVDSVADEE